MLVLCNLVAAMQSVVIFTAKYYGYLDRNRLNIIHQPAPRLKKITINPKYIDVYKKTPQSPHKKPQKLNHKTYQPGTHWQTYMYLQWYLYFTRKRENQKFSRCCYFLNAKYLPSLTLRLYYKTLSENLPLIIFPGKKLDQLYFDINCMHYSVRRLKSSKYNQFDPRKCV